MRKLLRMLLPVLLAVILPAVASAHDSAVSGVLSLDPPVPVPGQTATLKVALMDAYLTPIPRAQVRATLSKDGAPAPAPVLLTEQSEGEYAGNVVIPPEGMAIVRVEAAIAGDAWTATLPVAVGADGSPVAEMTLQFVSGNRVIGSEARPVTAAPDPVPGARPASTIIKVVLWPLGFTLLVLAAIGAGTGLIRRKEG